MTVFQAFLLSFVQGATEFLPVSSSGHLVIAQALFEEKIPKEPDILFEVLVHVATLIPVLFVFRARIWSLLQYAFRRGWRVSAEKGFQAAWTSHPEGRLILGILLATGATGTIGIAGKDFFQSLFARPDRVGWALCITATLLAATWFAKKTPTPETENGGNFPFWKTLLLGMVQGLAITPGISRSGATIAAALLLGMNRRAAGEFSFLIAIPAILGALLLEIRGFEPENAALSFPAGAVAMIVAAVSGYLFLKILLRFVQGGRLHYFAPYCLAVGIGAIFWFSR